MGFLIFFHYIIILIVLISIHAPWWAWIIHAVSAVVWFVIWALSDGGSNGKTTDTSKQEQS